MKPAIVFIAILLAVSACTPQATPMAERATDVPAAAITAPAATKTLAAAPTETLAPTSTVTPEPTLTPTSTPVPKATRLLIGYGEVQGSSMVGKGIYLLNLTTHRREPVLEGNYLLQALAEDNDALLISSGAQLFLYRLSEGGDPVLLTDQFDPRIRHMETMATWVDAYTIVFASPSTIQQMHLGDETPTPIVNGFYLLPEIIPSGDPEGVYWKDDTLPSLRYSGVNGAAQGVSAEFFAPACISYPGDKAAYRDQSGFVFTASDLGGNNAHQIFGPESPVYRLQILWSQGGGVYHCQWTRDGKQILLSVNTKMASPWEGEYHHFLLNEDGKLAAEIPVELVGNEWLVSDWSPDDSQILFYYLNHGFTVMDAKTFEVEDLSMELGISESNAVDRVYWLP